MGNQMTKSTEQESPDHSKMDPTRELQKSEMPSDTSCIKEKLDTLIEGYLKAPDTRQGESPSSIEAASSNKQGFLTDQNVLKTVQNKAENNNEIVSNGTKEDEKADKPKSKTETSQESTSVAKTEENSSTNEMPSTNMTMSNVASFESMIERALNDSMTTVEDSNEKTRILEMCEEEHKVMKKSEKIENVCDKGNDDMSLSKKNVMFLKDHIERVLEKNFPSVGSKKEETHEESKSPVKTKPKASLSLAPGLTLEQHMQKLIDEHLSKDDLSSENNSQALSKIIKSSQSSGDVKKNVMMTSSGYDTLESSKTNTVNAVSKPVQTNQSPIMTKSKCHSVETVVDRIIKKAVNDSFPTQKSQIYPKDYNWKTIHEEIYSECDTEPPKKLDSSIYTNNVEESRMKNQDMKHSHHQQKVLNSGKGNNHVEMYHTASQPPYFYPPYMKPNSQYPTAHKQNTKYDNKHEPHSNYHGYPLKNCDKGGRLVSNSEISQRNRMDMGSSSHHPHDIHLMPQMMNSQYSPMDKSKYPHPNSIRYPSKSMEDISQASIPSAMAPGPLPAQRHCHPNSPFRMPQLYPNNPPIPSPREYFNNSTNSKDHLLVPGNRSSISKSPGLPHSSPNHLPPSSPRSPRQASPSVYPPSKPEIKQGWQRQDLSPSNQSNPRKREASGLDLSVKQTSQSGNEELPLDLTCKKPRVSPHPNPAYSSGLAYPAQMDKHDISKSIHISQLQNSMDKFCQQANANVDVSMGRMPPAVKGHEHFPSSLMMNPQWSNVSRAGPKNSIPPMMPNPGQERLEVVRPHPIHQQHLPRMPIRPPITSPHHLPQEAPESPSDSTSTGIKRSGSVSRHEPIQNIIGNHSPSDILYLICRLCNQTYGSPYGFRKHFRNQHGFEPRSEHTIVQTISGTKAMQSPAIGPHFEMQGMTQMGVPPHLSPNTKSRSPREYLSHSHSPNNFERPPSAMSIRHGTGNFGYSPTGNENRRPESLPNTTAPVPVVSESCVADPQRMLKSEEKTEQQTSPKYLECHECGQTFQLNDFGSYKRHCRTHGNPRLDPFTGGITENSVPLHPSEESYKALSNNKSMCKDGEILIEVFGCKYCPFTSKVGDLLEDHISRHHPEKQKKLICILCNGKFHLYEQFKIHMEKKHRLTAPSYAQFKCPETSIEREGKIFIKQGREGMNDSTNIPNDLNKSYKAIPTSQIMKMSADNAVTSASPDSSSDPITSSQADSQTTATVSTSQNSTAEVKTGQQSQPSNVSRQTSCDSESDKSLDCSEMKYLHKKFKRKAFSSEKSESSDIKKMKSASGVDSPCSNSCTSLDSDSNSVQTTDDSENQKTDVGQKSLNKGKMESGNGEELSQNEARHHLPFVWDRITRSQVGKTVKPAK